MLAIKGNSGRWGSWHTGETMHVPAGRVLTFQADGHELDWLLEAIASELELNGLRIHYDEPDERLTPVL